MNCPNKNSKEWQELTQAVGEDLAYYLWNKNNENPLNKAPNGKDSRLFKDLLEIANKDKQKALQLKSQVYSKKFLDWFGDWIENSKNYGEIQNRLEDIIPDLIDDKLKEIYDNYVKLMQRNKNRIGKEMSFESFKSFALNSNVLHYKNTYIFGYYDNINNVFIVTASSSPSSKELLAEAIPYISKNFDVIGFAPKDVVEKYKKSGYIASNSSFAYNFKGEKMNKFLYASNPNLIKRITGKNIENLTPSEIKNLDTRTLAIKEYKELLQELLTNKEKSDINIINQKLKNLRVPFHQIVKFIKDVRENKLKFDEKSLRSRIKSLYDFKKVEITKAENKLINNISKNAHSELNKILINYLSNFGIKIKELENIQKELGIDSFGTADILNKILYIDKNNTEELPEIAGYFIAYMMQYNALITPIIKELQEKSRYKNASKDELLRIIGELIANELHKKTNTEIPKSLKEKIKILIDYFFSLINKIKTKQINKNIGIITDNILAQNQSLITASKYKPGAYGKKIQRVSLQEALDSDEFASSIVDKMAEEGFILTGSIVLAEQGSIFRPSEKLVHDLDWKSPFNEKTSLEKFSKLFPDNKYIREIKDTDKDKITHTFLVSPENTYIDNLKLEGERNIITYYEIKDSKGNIIGTYHNENGIETSEGVEGITVDIFTQSFNKDIKYSSFELKSGKNLKLAKWQDIFKAKLEFARIKDIWDYNRFIPNEYLKNNTSKIVDENGEPLIQNGKFVNENNDIKPVISLNPKYRQETVNRNNIAYQKLQTNTATKSNTEIEKEKLKKISTNLSKRIGLKVEFVDKPDANWKGRFSFSRNVAEINLATATLDTPIHEIIAHPIIHNIFHFNDFANRNLPLIKSIKDKMEKYEDFPEMLSSLTNEEYDFIEKLGLNSLVDDDFYKFNRGRIIDKLTRAVNSLEQSYNPEFEQIKKNFIKEINSSKLGQEILNRLKQDENYLFEFMFAGTTYNEIDNTKEFIKNGYKFIYDLTDDKFTKIKFENNKEVGEEIPISEQEFRDNNKENIQNALYEEAIVEYMGLYSKNLLDNNKDKNIIRIIRDFLQRISDYLRSLLSDKEIKLTNLTSDITIKDLSEIIVNTNHRILLPNMEIKYIRHDGAEFDSWKELNEDITSNLKSKHLINDYVGEKIQWDYTGVSEFEAYNRLFLENKLIIDKWKEVNNIKYNPDEVYVKNYEFVHKIGAYVGTDNLTLLQNYIAFVEDSLRFNVDMILSTTMRHKDKRVSFEKNSRYNLWVKLYPKSEDILWATPFDAYSGNITFEGKHSTQYFTNSDLVNPNLTGTAFTKYPEDKSIISETLTKAIENTVGYNEAGIKLTPYNFRFEYEGEIPIELKELADKVNKILDERYGKLEKPVIKDGTKLHFLKNTLKSLERNRNVQLELMSHYTDETDILFEISNKLDEIDFEIYKVKQLINNLEMQGVKEIILDYNSEAKVSILDIEVTEEEIAKAEEEKTNKMFIQIKNGAKIQQRPRGLIPYTIKPKFNIKYPPGYKFQKTTNHISNMIKILNFENVKLKSC